VDVVNKKNGPTDVDLFRLRTEVHTNKVYLNHLFSVNQFIDAMGVRAEIIEVKRRRREGRGAVGADGVRCMERVPLPGISFEFLY